MRRLSNFFLIAAIVALAGAGAGAAEPSEETGDPASEPPGVTSSYTAVRLGLVLQTGYEFLPDQVENRRNSFTLQRARLRLDGHLFSEDFTYLFAGDAVGGFGVPYRLGAPGAEIVGEDGDQGIPFLLDARLGWNIPKIGFSFWIGRFVPSWGLLMPEKSSRLGAINYPLYVYGGENAIGRFRNVGAQAQIELIDFLEIGAGIFNGGLNTWRDENDSKDVLVFVTAKPIGGLVVRASSFFSFPLVKDGVHQDQVARQNGDEIHFSPILEARFLEYGFDLMIGAAANIVLRHDDDLREDYQAYGFMGHAGYVVVGDWLQIIGRAEWWEPHNKVSDNAQLRITAGPQVLVESIHLQLNINYMYDSYNNSLFMCKNYLGLSNCELDPSAQAKKRANTLLVQFTVDI